MVDPECSRLFAVGIDVGNDVANRVMLPLPLRCNATENAADGRLSSLKFALEWCSNNILSL